MATTPPSKMSRRSFLRLTGAVGVSAAALTTLNACVAPAAAQHRLRLPQLPRCPLHPRPPLLPQAAPSNGPSSTHCSLMPTAS